MISYLVKGGIIMIPILLCSVVALAAFFERMWALRGSRVLPRDLVGQAEALTRKGALAEAIALCRRTGGPLSRIVEAALQNAGQDRDTVKEAVQEVGRREAALLDRYVGVLGTMANVSPLLGLLGTVSGMIKAFNVISLQGVGNPASLASGISEALITTAAGLTVAIPSFLAYRWFLSRVDRTVLAWEQVAVHFVDLLKHPGRARGSWDG